MGIAERKERAAEAMRERILDAAEELLREDGPAKVSMRGIAHRIEYSPAALYSYFSGKEALFQELRRRGFSRLLQGKAELDTALSPEAKLELMYRGYLRFAQDNPHLYELMFLTPHQECEPDGELGMDGLMLFSQAVWDVLAGKEAAPPAPDDLLKAGISHWAGLHGLAMILINNNLLFLPPEKRQAVVEQALETMLARRTT